jgi:hypothetical protein
MFTLNILAESSHWKFSSEKPSIVG